MRRLLLLSAFLLASALATMLTSPPQSASTGARATARLALSEAEGVAPTPGVTTITTDTLIIPTYSFASALFTATNTLYNIPYRWLHWSEYDKTGRTKSDQAYTRLTLENDWLRASLLPELGGRVYEMIFKPTGNDELYKNPVVKPTHWGPPEQGWWLAAGGIEWGLPVEEHGYESAIPWGYTISQSGEGITVTLRDSVAPDRLRASVDVFLPNDRAVLIVRPRIENARSVPLDFKWWANAMLAPGPSNTVGPDLHFVFPVDAVTVHSTGDDRLPGHGWPPPGGPSEWITWPMHNGVDWSRLGNFDEWFGFFGRPQAQQGFVGVYDTAADEGVARIFPRHVATGIKGFAMGWAHAIGSGEWTDDGSYYVELHGGLAPTFWDTARLEAGESIEWEETWYPVAGVDGFTTANGEAALRVDHSGAALDLGVFSTRARDAAQLSVWRRSTCEPIARFAIDSIDPASPRRFLAPTGIPLADLAILITQDDALIVGYSEKDCVAPAAAVNALPNVSTSIALDVSWSGSDVYSGVASYDVQVKDGFGGPWTPWLTTTNALSATYTGAHGHTYFFRARALDLAGNQGAYQHEEWGDTFTTVLLSPAAVMETSRKTTAAFFEQGRPARYSILVHNTGNLSSGITLTDTLPLSMTLVEGTLSASSGPAPVFDGAHIRWSDAIADGDFVTITYSLTPTADLRLMQPLTNTVVIEGGVAPVIRTAVTAMAHVAYLPLILRWR